MTVAEPRVSGDVRAWLDGLDQARENATPGPWQYDGDAVAWDSDPDYPEILARFDRDADAAVIVAEHNALPRLTAALRAVLELAEELDRDARARPIADEYAARIRRAAEGIR